MHASNAFVCLPLREDRVGEGGYRGLPRFELCAEQLLSTVCPHLYEKEREAERQRHINTVRKVM